MFWYLKPQVMDIDYFMHQAQWGKRWLQFKIHERYTCLTEKSSISNFFFQQEGEKEHHNKIYKKSSIVQYKISR